MAFSKSFHISYDFPKCPKGTTTFTSYRELLQGLIYLQNWEYKELHNNIALPFSSKKEVSKLEITVEMISFHKDQLQGSDCFWRHYLYKHVNNSSLSWSQFKMR